MSTLFQLLAVRNMLQPVVSVTHPKVVERFSVGAAIGRGCLGLSALLLVL